MRTPSELEPGDVVKRMTRRHIGTCPKCKAVISENRLGCSVYRAHCRACPDGVVRMAYVVGTLTAKPCDSRCTSARGRDCECSCGGRQHGADWAVVRFDDETGQVVTV